MRFAARKRNSVETVLNRLERLTRERQALQERRAECETLEQNRLQIVQAQWELSHALIDRHLGAAG
jgi:hypothetical protein